MPMFAALKTACRRIYAAVALVFLAVFRLLRWLLSTLLGQWQPPYWLRRLA